MRPGAPAVAGRPATTEAILILPVAGLIVSTPAAPRFAVADRTRVAAPPAVGAFAERRAVTSFHRSFDLVRPPFLADLGRGGRAAALTRAAAAAAAAAAASSAGVFATALASTRGCCSEEEDVAMFSRDLALCGRDAPFDCGRELGFDGGSEDRSRDDSLFGGSPDFSRDASRLGGSSRDSRDSRDFLVEDIARVPDAIGRERSRWLQTARVAAQQRSVAR